MRALDLSFSAASLAWCQARKAEGWELLIADLWTGVSTPAPARANLANARQAGMLTAGYTVVNNLSGITAINKAATAAGPEWDHLSFVSVDVEVPTTPAIIREAVDGLRAQGKLVCIYSANWFWKSLDLSGHDFSDVASWLADYDGNPAIDTPPLNKLGPVIGKQYKNSHDIGGVTVDANAFDDAFIKEEDMATLAELEAALAQLRQDATSSDAQLRADIAQLRKDATAGDDGLRARVSALESAAPTIHTHETGPPQ